MLNKDKIKEEFRKKFGQFYISLNEDNTPRLIDLKDVMRVVSRDDGENLQVVASGDIENFLAHLTAQYEKLIEECLPPYLKGIDKVPEVMEKDRLYNLMNENMTTGYNIAINDIRTSLQERGIKIK